MDSKSDDRLIRACEMLDYLMISDLRLYFQDRQVWRALYESAREATSEGEAKQLPITYTAAKKILYRVKAGDIVFITTGWKTAYRPYGETDGPLGAIVLARAISRACKALPVFLAEKDIIDTIIPLCRAAGMNVLDLEIARDHGSSACVRAIPIGEDESKRVCVNLSRELNPSCVVSVERPGRNWKGVHHYTRGLSCSEGIAYLDYLFEEAARRKVLSIGIGDLGNELGLGKLKETVGEYIQYGSKCLCPCGGGIAASDPAEVTVFSATSNWGAYGIAAALAMMKQAADILHDSEMEYRLFDVCVENGIVDGSFNTPTFTVDTIPRQATSGMLELMRVIVTNGITNQ